ncbi:HTH-type transcriptional repressor NsrR [Maioricimonas rarisocia]|uniref:HTH-type transcriptional repressor NsrR n=1 Tax=Maioricimonas rarisocia TaxID=2528026 RepID=A0A517Z6K4_9PLAN|nr:Rrf2 family transcriptional regulator [Maioricimonas rarisocia]QDU38059.1 HTH-type transcriptional repressor NsrR [Maioricimonas rarisocia]
MRLTTQTDYALRTLMFLATFGGRATSAQIAGLFGISANHVAKVVNQLARLGYVRSIRGIGGGIELACDPSTVQIGKVIEDFEGNMHLLECVDAENVCAIEQFCKLKGVLAKAERLQRDYLNSVTLADVVPAKNQLNQVAHD